MRRLIRTPSVHFTILLAFVLCSHGGDAESNDEAAQKSLEHQILHWISGLQQKLMPLSKSVLAEMLQRRASLTLPVRADPGRCYEDSHYTMERAMYAEPWTLAMLDASSKLMPGLMDGRVQDLGNYDQCVRVKEPEGQFTGQHCLVEARGLLTPELQKYFGRTTMNDSYPGGFTLFMLCVPSSCTKDDVLNHVSRSLLSIANVTLTDRTNVFCPSDRQQTFQAKDWWAVGVLVTIMLLVLLSTCYEWATPRSKSELLSSFSVISNWRILVDQRSIPDVSCLDGLRLICAAWVLVTHRFFLLNFVPYFNYTSYLEQRKSLLLAILASGSMATEVFFVLAGITRAYSFLKARRNGKAVNHMYHSIRRYFRVTPVMAVMVIYTSTLAFHISDGPLWSKCLGLDKDLCTYLWFLNIFHVSNFIIFKCRIESWFLASDFQLYLLSPLVLLPLWRRPRLGFSLLTGCFLLSVFVKCVASYYQLLYPDIIILEGQKPTRDFSYAHTFTPFRLEAYAMGVALGYVLYHFKYGGWNTTLSKPLVWLGWSLCIIVVLATFPLHAVYLDPDYEDNGWMSVFYVGIWETVFSAAIAWLVLACSLGYGGWINTGLSLPVLRPFAKLSFSMYLIHMPLQTLLIYRTRVAVDYRAADVVYSCVSDFVVAMCLATIMYLTVETPVCRVVSHLLRHKLSAKAELHSQPKDNHKIKKKMK